MTHALIVNSSALGDNSVSNSLTAELAGHLKALDADLEIKVRDIGAEPLPHLTAATVSAIRGKPDTDEAERTLALSDALIGELRGADLIVIGSPMYNFGISSTLKAWFDHILRAGQTFRYREDGSSEGLLKGKKAVVIETRAGFYSEGPLGHMDGQEPHLRTMLGFMGIEDVVFVRAEKLAFGPEAASAAIAAAAKELHDLSSEELALAA